MQKNIKPISFSFIFAVTLVSFIELSGCSNGTSDYQATPKKSGDANAASASPAVSSQSTVETVIPVPKQQPVTPAVTPTSAPVTAPVMASSSPSPSPSPTAHSTRPVPEKSLGCSGTSDLPEGSATVMINSKAWAYTVRKPAGYSRDKVWPLVLALHPNGGDASYWDGTTGDRAIRPLLAQKAVIIVAQALGKDWRTDLPADRLYFDAVIKKVKEGLCIDQKRIFSMGFSGGGSFSGDLGCNRTDIRAIAVGGAVEYFDNKTCVGKPAAWITIGDDEAVPDRITFRDFWRNRNTCEMTGTQSIPSTCTAYKCPSADTPVTFCSHVGGHEWPSFGTKAALDFFSQF
ncbi:MAG: hypothetical protein H7249_09060 [Chitinophagaceae bacterium]|nr:hypothetical protein [Oligoflexus sp.]